MSAVDAKNIIINVGVVDGASPAFHRIGNSAMTMGAKTNAGMGKAQSGMAAFGQTAGKVATIGAAVIAAGLLFSAKAAIDFESSFAGVRKTVDTSEAGFRKLADGVRAMAREIPIGVNELNRIMELGGQLGVGPANLLEFTDTIANSTMVAPSSSLPRRCHRLRNGAARLCAVPSARHQSFNYWRRLPWLN